MSQITIYSLPGCKHCSALKEWLNELGVPFIDEPLTTEIQTDLIMGNIFSDPPIIKIDEGLITAEKIYHDEVLDKSFLSDCLKIGEFVREN